MSSKRIVVTAPWRLGLFVFLLVVGCAAGLAYAYLELFGGSPDLDDPDTMGAILIVAVGVVALGLLGYMAVVTAAQPVERVISGNNLRRRMFKRLKDLKDPREINPEDFSSEPVVARLLERWRDTCEDLDLVRNEAAAARGAAEGNDGLFTKISRQITAAVEGEGTVDIEGASGALAELVAAANALLHHTRQLQAGESQEVQAVRAALGRGAAELRRHQSALAEVAGSLRRVHELVTGTAGAREGDVQPVAAPSGEDMLLDSNVAMLGDRCRERIHALRERLDGLAEEANAGAIKVALHVSRLGEAGNALVEVAEEIRSMSTRLQKVVADLQLCEYDHEMLQSQIHNLLGRVEEDWRGKGEVAPPPATGMEQAAMALARDLPRLQAEIEALGRGLDALDAVVGATAPAPSPSASSASPAAAPASRPAAAAAGGNAAESSPRAATPSGGSQPATSAESPEERLAQVHAELMSGAARFGDVDLDAVSDAAEGAGRVYDLEEFGAVALEGEDGDRIYDLTEFGAVAL